MVPLLLKILLFEEKSLVLDERLKTEIKTIDNTDEMLEKIKGVEFNWKHNNRKSGVLLLKILNKLCLKLFYNPVVLNL